MSAHEPECVALKRRGQEHVRQLLAGMSREEQLNFWRKQIERLRTWQEDRRSGSTQLDPATYSLQEDNRVRAG